MARRRFKELGMGTFFGDFVYERVVPREHFLVKLREVIDWGSLHAHLAACVRGDGREGAPAILAGGDSEDAGGGISVPIV